MTDLIALMSKLVKPDGTILVPGVDEMVPPPTEEEKCVFDFGSILHPTNAFESQSNLR